MSHSWALCQLLKFCNWKAREKTILSPVHLECVFRHSVALSHSDVLPLARSKCHLFPPWPLALVHSEISGPGPLGIPWHLFQARPSSGHPITLHLQVVQGDPAIVHTEPLSLETPELSRQVFLMSKVMLSARQGSLTQRGQHSPSKRAVYSQLKWGHVRGQQSTSPSCREKAKCLAIVCAHGSVAKVPEGERGTTISSLPSLIAPTLAPLWVSPPPRFFWWPSLLQPQEELGPIAVSMAAYNYLSIIVIIIIHTITH